LIGVNVKALKSCLIALPLALGACAELPEILQSGAEAAGYGSQEQLVRGIKETLEIASTRAAEQLSREGGYSDDPRYRIELPEELQGITGRLRQFGLGSQLDRVEALMNQGAERAADEARQVFVNAVRNMTVRDALSIVRGHDTAATEYFRDQAEAELRQRYQPIVEENLRQIGFYDRYQQFLRTYEQIPLPSKPSLDLEEHVLDQSLNALFSQVAEEERLIREDPVGRGSAVIARVFGRN
jgi:hypothetical protein